MTAWRPFHTRRCENINKHVRRSGLCSARSLPVFNTAAAGVQRQQRRRDAAGEGETRQRGGPKRRCHGERPLARKVPKGLLLRRRRGTAVQYSCTSRGTCSMTSRGTAVFYVYPGICKLYRFMVSQKKEYTGCTELTAVQYSYSFFLIQVCTILHIIAKS